MPEILNVGPFMIKLSWLLLAISGIAGYWAMKFKWKKTQYVHQPILDLLFNGLMIIFFTWKLSSVLFTPSLLWKQPLSLLFSSGSLNGLLLGLLFAIIYMELKLRSYKFPRWILLDLLPYGICIMILVFSLFSWQYGSLTTLPWGISIENPDFKYHPINIYLVIVTLLMLGWLWKRDVSILGSGVLFFDFLTFYGMGLMMISIFKTQINIVYGISEEQFLYLLMMIIGRILMLIHKRKTVITPYRM